MAVTSEWPDVTWLENGQAAISGDVLRLERQLDALFLAWAARWRAAEYRFPTFIRAKELARLDYFQSFPHLVTFPVALDAGQENLARFAAGEPIGADGAVHLTDAAPILDALTPAACYHFYAHFQGDTFDRPRYLTTRNTCFRREAYYAPLRRQWSFSMRELVCVGSAQEVETFLATTRGWVSDLFHRIGLPVEWEQATDPFFNPSRNPKYLAQRVEPVKTEMVFGGDLAIGSVNLHRDYFGDAFRLRRGEKAAFSGCVAFGIERWLYAWLTHFGPRIGDWPDLPEANA